MFQNFPQRQFAVMEDKDNKYKCTYTIVYAHIS